MINGSRFLLYRDDVPVGHTTGLSLTLDVDLVESTNKDSLSFQEILPGVRSGQITATGFTNYDDNVNFEELADMVLTRTNAEFFIGTATPPNGLIFQGDGFVTSVEEVAEMESITSYDLEITVTGLYTVLNGFQGQFWNTVQGFWNQIDVNWNEI